MSSYQMVVVGNGGVGKSATAIRYIHSTFLDEYDPTIEDLYHKQVVIDDEPCSLEILDTAVQDEYRILPRDISIQHGQGIVIMFSISTRSSFEDLYIYKDWVSNVRGPAHVPIVLVGNKVDDEQHRVVTSEEAQALAKQWGVPYYEASAKTGVNVAELFEQLVREIRNARHLAGGPARQARK